MESDLFTYAETAAVLSTSERHVRELWERREIRATKVGRLVRFHREDIAKYIENQREAW